MDKNKLLGSYEEAAILYGKFLVDGNDKLANKEHSKLTNIYQKLCELSDGNELAIFLNHKSHFVRCWAAVHSLNKIPEEAEKVLIDISKGDCVPINITAEILLEQWKAGELEIG